MCERHKSFPFWKTFYLAFPEKFPKTENFCGYKVSDCFQKRQIILDIFLNFFYANLRFPLPTPIATNFADF